jgi:CYTH domain-containing protein
MEDYEAQKALDAELEQNRINSEKAIDEWFGAREMTDDQKAEYGAFVKTTLDNAFKGAITPELLDKMYYAMKYNSDVDEAKKVGVVQGKNAAIVEAEKVEDVKAAGDGLPNVDGSAVVKVAAETPSNTDPFVQGLRTRAVRKPVLKGNY